MKSMHSMVVAFDGESRCGKTTLIDAVYDETAYQADSFRGVTQNETGEWDFIEQEELDKLEAFRDSLSFQSAHKISAGNMFRAATLYALEERASGRTIEEFTTEDSPRILSLLATGGIYDLLQEDPDIGENVSKIGRTPGAQALCNTVFCDAVTEAYHKEGGANLVIIDARNPVPKLSRHGKIGQQPEQIKQGSIMPIFIDTPAEVAAERMKGDYDANLELVQARRRSDRTRPDHPFVFPVDMEHSMIDWFNQFAPPVQPDKLARPLLLDNGRHVTLENIQWFAGFLSMTAQDTAHHLDQALTNAKRS